jgi:hypothetical protein
MRFREWLIQTEGLMNSRLRKIASPLVIGTAMMGIMPKVSRIHPDKATEVERKADLIQYVKKTYGYNLNPDQIAFYKPLDVIHGFYGDKTDSAISNAVKAQKPADSKSGLVFNQIRMMQYVPVINVSPDELKGKLTGNVAFCSNDAIGNPFCVVAKKDEEEALAHELTHAAQNTFKERLIRQFTDADIDNSDLDRDEKNTVKYYLMPHEFGVRVAQFKRDYFALTKHVLGDSEDEMLKAIQHLLANRYSYHPDARNLADLFIYLEKVDDGQVKLIEAILDALPKVVVNNKPVNVS